jgi:FAD:protein FMN transferase
MKRVDAIWGTAIGVDVRDTADDPALDGVFEWFDFVDRVFSTWRDDSDISRLGRGEVTINEVHADVRRVLELCDRVSIQSGGAFDITVGADPRVDPRPGLGPIDPSGLVKGWALDQAAVMLRTAGFNNFTINAGGDVVVAGRPAHGEEWRVGIQHPWCRHQVVAVVSGEDIAVATSGRYERGEHVVDPRTGKPPKGLMSVTVIGNNLAMADGYATAALVLGDEGMPWLASLDGFEGLAITDDGHVVSTAGFDPYRRQ